MQELIKEMILNSEESGTVFIGDGIEIGETVLELMEDGVQFCEADFDYVENLIEENDILAIAKNIYEDGEIEYFIEKVFSKDGETLEDDSDIVFIDSDLADCIDIKKFSGMVMLVECTYENDSEEECNYDCDNCEYSDDEDYEKEIEEEDTTEILFEELLSSIDELDLDKYLVGNIYNLIKDTISDAIEMGYEEGFDDCLKDVRESIDHI